MAAAPKFQVKPQALQAVGLAETAWENEVISILGRLRAPNAYDLSRKRKLVVNTGGYRCAQGKVSAKKMGRRV